MENTMQAVEWFTITGPYAVAGRQYKTLKMARTKRDGLDAKYGASCHSIVDSLGRTRI